MADVFVSYRRSDSGDIAGRLADRLKELPQVDSVFLDVESIPVGANFVEKITHVIGRAEYCIIVIGPNWHGPQAGGAARIMDPGDFVRLEVDHALSRDIKVIPVLVHGAEMPGGGVLPPALRELAFHNAFPIRSEFFVGDCEDLFDGVFGADRVKPGRSLAQKVTGWGLRGFLGALATGALMTVGALGFNLGTGRSLDSLVGYNSEALALMLITGLLFGAMVSVWRPWRRA